MFLHLRLPVLNDIIDLRYNIGFGNAPNEFRLPLLHTAGLSRQFTSDRLIFCKQIHGGSTHVQKNRRRSSCAHYTAEAFLPATRPAQTGERIRSRRKVRPCSRARPIPHSPLRRIPRSNTKSFRPNPFQGQRPSAGRFFTMMIAYRFRRTNWFISMILPC